MCSLQCISHVSRHTASSTVKRSTVIALLAATAAVVGCGGSKPSSDHGYLARIGDKTVTRAEVNHWTATFVDGDYYSALHERAPKGLATNPVDYRACVSAAKRARSPHAKKPSLSSSVLTTRCHELYEDTRREALSYLISVRWSEEQAAERGLTATSADVQERIAQNAKEYTGPESYAEYLVKKGWDRADLNVIVKRNILVGLNIKHLEALAGTGPSRQRNLIRVYTEEQRKWTGRTYCAPEAIVENCRQYKPPKSQPRSPVAIFEELNGLS
jgi:hypothetical protein